MTIFAVTGHEQALTLRYIPVLAWAFGAIATYGVADVLASMSAGAVPVNPASVMALLLLIGFTLFMLVIGGQLVVAHFDRPANLVRVRRYGVTGFSRAERPLNDLVGLDLRLLRRARHRLELRFRSGERLPLTNNYVLSLNRKGLSRLSAMLGIEPTVATEQPPQA